MPIVDNGVYVAGQRIQNPTSLTETFEYTREHHGMAWIGMFRPTAEEIAQVADEFSLHPLAVEDALRVTSARSWSATATSCSSCSAPPGTSTRPRPWSSASCTCSSAPTSS